MKTKLIFLSIFFIALFSSEAYSQYYGTGGGVDRSMTGQYSVSPKKAKKAEKKDFVDSSVEYLNKELKLDGLQQAAIRSIMNDNKNSIEETSAINISYEEKRDKMQVINDKINANIMKILSKEQGEKYTKMKEEREKKALRN